MDIGLIIKDIPVEKVDMEIPKRVVGNCIHETGSEITFEVIVRNAATSLTAIPGSVMVADTLLNNLTLTGFHSSKGTYNPTTHEWGPFTMVASESDTLTIKAKINNINRSKGGSVCNEAEVVKAVGIDADSEPNNFIKSEDDYAIACVSVPIAICTARKDTIIISAPGGYSTYQWFKDGFKMTGATNQTLEIGTQESYTVEIV